MFIGSSTAGMPGTPAGVEGGEVEGRAVEGSEVEGSEVETDGDEPAAAVGGECRDDHTTIASTNAMPAMMTAMRVRLRVLELMRRAAPMPRPARDPAGRAV